MFEWCAIVAVVVGNAAVAAVASARRNNVRARISAARVAPSKIAEAADGTVHLVGRVVERGSLLRSVIEGGPCVFSDVIVEAARPRTWGTNVMLREVRGVGFDLDDGTGVAQVVFQDEGRSPPLAAGPRHVDCAIPRAFREGGTLFRFNRRSAPIAERLLAEHGIDPPGFLLQRSCRACEGVIRPGDEVSVIGRGTREVAGDAHAAGYRGAPLRYVVRAGPDAPLTIIKNINLAERRAFMVNALRGQKPQP